MLAAAAAVAPATAGGVAEPSFRATVHATFHERVVYAVDAGGGCELREATRDVELQSVKPFTRTLSKLLDRNFVFELAARERRTTRAAGACPADARPVRDDSSGCGTVSYEVGSIGTGAGYRSRRSEEFWVYYTRIGPDPYEAHCVSALWGPHSTPGTDGRPVSGMTTVNFPPGDVWQPSTRPFGVVVPRAELAKANRRVVRFSDRADAPAYGPVVARDVAVEWDVTLVRAAAP